MPSSLSSPHFLTSFSDGERVEESVVEREGRGRRKNSAGGGGGMSIPN